MKQLDQQLRFHASSGTGYPWETISWQLSQKTGRQLKASKWLLLENLPSPMFQQFQSILPVLRPPEVYSLASSCRSSQYQMDVSSRQRLNQIGARLGPVTRSRQKLGLCHRRKWQTVSGNKSKVWRETAIELKVKSLKAEILSLYTSVQCGTVCRAEV